MNKAVSRVAFTCGYMYEQTFLKKQHFWPYTSKTFVKINYYCNNSKERRW